VIGVLLILYGVTRTCGTGVDVDCLDEVGRACGHRPVITLRPGRTGLEMAGSAAKDGVSYPLQQRVINPIVLLAWELGIPPPGDALLETTGRRTGRPRRTPVCDGLEGETFWLVAQRGRRADWVKNIQANPRVRVKVRSGSGVGWRAGTAHILDDDDPRQRQRRMGRGNLARRLCVSASAAMGTDPLTVRIDLDSRSSAGWAAPP
jgi:deazaflavin-dependent oxidoreductase (nitroreductase family)